MAYRIAGIFLLGIFAGQVNAQQNSMSANISIVPAASPIANTSFDSFTPGSLPTLGLPYALAQKTADKEKKEPKKDEPRIAPEDLDFLRTDQLAFQPIDNKPMIADFRGPIAQQIFTVKSTVTIPVPVFDIETGRPLPPRIVTAEVVDQISILAPVLSRGSFKIADNASPRPLDRVYVSYNYYHDVPVPIRGAGLSTFTLTSVAPFTPFGGVEGVTVLQPISRQANSSSDAINNLLNNSGKGPFTLRQSLAGTLTNDPNSPRQSLAQSMFSFVNVHSETIGIEKTFFDAAGSIELRLPFLQVRQNSSTTINSTNLQNLSAGLPVSGQITEISNNQNDSFVGDLTIIGKYVLFENRDTGNLISAGLALTVPSGQAVTVAGPVQNLGGVPTSTAGPVLAFAPNQSFRSTLFQPFVGYIFNFDRFYFHGFSSGVFPTESRDAVLLFNDWGLAYRLFERREGFLRGITPTVEGHLTNGLNHSNPNEGVRISDVFAFDFGVHFQLGSHAILTFGLSTPVTGPRPYHTEGILLFNVLF